jgi:hypothetical protein
MEKRNIRRAQRLQYVGLGICFVLVLGLVAAEQGWIDVSVPVTPAKSKLSYEFVRAEVLGPRCIPCHGPAGDVSFETYASTRNNLEKIRVTALEKRRMPPVGSLSRRERAILSAWIEAGAPAEAADTNR